MLASHTRRIRLLAATFGLAAAVLARAETITLLSADPALPEGAEVPMPRIEAIDGVTLVDAVPSVVTDTAAWSFPFEDGSAAYVSSCPTCGSVLASCGGEGPAAPASIRFVHTFKLPQGYSSPTLTMTTTNDDAGDVYLNGNLIGSVVTYGYYPGAMVATITVTDPSFFKQGNNELRYELVNYNAPCPLSAAYRAVIDYTPSSK